MTEAEVIRIMRQHLEGQFPKTCPNCETVYPTLKNYLQNTNILGSAISYDAEFRNWKPTQPLGTLTYANCRCGGTMSLSSEGLPLWRLWRLLNWARIETKKREMAPNDLLNYLRDEICKQVLGE
jgi:hypothetical protein